MGCQTRRPSPALVAHPMLMRGYWAWKRLWREERNVKTRIRYVTSDSLIDFKDSTISLFTPPIPQIAFWRVKLIIIVQWVFACLFPLNCNTTNTPKQMTTKSILEIYCVNSLNVIPHHTALLHLIRLRYVYICVERERTCLGRLQTQP